MPILTKQKDLPDYVTKDQSTICELMHPLQHSNSKQSLAYATVEPQKKTQLHYHKNTEELYHILQGSGLMTINQEQFPVEVGDTICIPPNSHHNIHNTGNTNLEFLCCCSPAYSHEDTFIVRE